MDRANLLSCLLPDRMVDGDATRRRVLGETVSWLNELHADKTAGKLHATIHEILDRGFDKAALQGHAQRCRAARAAFSGALDAVIAHLEVIPDRCPEGHALSGRRFSALTAWLQRARSELDSLNDIVRFNQQAARLADDGLEAVIETATSWTDTGVHLTAHFEHTWLTALITMAFRENPSLAEFDGDSHQHIIERFRQLDLDLFRHNRALVAEAHWQRSPSGQGGGQIGVLRREFEKKRRHLPLRKLMAEAGNAILQIKPVFMMSPLSIAKFVPPGSVRFDLVIFDEASQVRPVDALGAILRAGQAVVVGDTRQLPPTSFFDRMAGEDADVEETTVTADLESILGMFCACGAPERMLRWHYRSRHESLIAVSNHEFYDNRLVLFPSPDAQREETGLHFRHDAGTCYERGNRKRFNAGEAGIVADAVMEHARRRPNLTLGVAAFSLSQARRIEDEVEIRRRADPSTEAFFADHPEEPFFVKNLENVQGDERDVMLVSVGYGRIEAGYMPMNFGPLNQEGGERRLNVLITRARLAPGGPRKLRGRRSRHGSHERSRRRSAQDLPAVRRDRDSRCPEGVRAGRQTPRSRRRSPTSCALAATLSILRSARQGSSSTSPSSTPAGPDGICWASNATARPTTAHVRPATETASGNRFSKVSAGRFTASGAPTGSCTRERADRKGRRSDQTCRIGKAPAGRRCETAAFRSRPAYRRRCFAGQTR